MLKYAPSPKYLLYKKNFPRVPSSTLNFFRVRKVPSGRDPARGSGYITNRPILSKSILITCSATVSQYFLHFQKESDLEYQSRIRFKRNHY
jgi:hypothetical protein